MARSNQCMKRERCCGNRFGRDIICSSSRNGRLIKTSLIDASVNLITIKKTYSEINRVD